MRVWMYHSFLVCAALVYPGSHSFLLRNRRGQLDSLCELCCRVAEVGRLARDVESATVREVFWDCFALLHGLART